MPENSQRQKMFLKPEAILRYLSGNEELHTLITTKNTEVDFVTTDQSLYEALGSTESRDKIDMNLLVKLLEVTTIVPHAEMLRQERKILTDERVEEIRKSMKE